MLSGPGERDIWEAEVSELAERFGPPQRVEATLDDEHIYVLRGGRQAEVCMVVARPSGKLLVITKPFYPNGVFRLPTGGVETGETILESLLREVWEETGLGVEVQRFLAWTRYRVGESDDFAFNTFAFLLDERGGALEVQDPDEPLLFGEVSVSELLDLAERLEGLPDIPSAQMDDSWRSWGRFRAIGQRAVHDALLLPQ